MMIKNIILIYLKNKKILKIYLRDLSVIFTLKKIKTQKMI